jgi:hypothetical protein
MYIALAAVLFLSVVIVTGLSQGVASEYELRKYFKYDKKRRR